MPVDAGRAGRPGLKLLKSCMRAVLPERVMARIVSIRSRNHQLKWLKEQGLLTMASDFANRYGTSVLHGPFRGMRYPPAAIASRHSIPKLLGSYEEELHPVIQSVSTKNYQFAVDVGSAEGYYAVGLARLTGLPVHAFDTEPRERDLCQEMARLNDASTVSAGKWCDGAALLRLVANRRCFVLSDCEGYEVELFSEPVIAALNRSDLVIELHPPSAHPWVERFAASHSIRIIQSTPRDPARYAELAFLGADAPRAVQEYRDPGQQWAVLTARAC